MVLKPASYTRLTALLFAEICAEAGLPPGVFNVVTGTGSFGSLLATHPLVDKVGFTGSTEVSMISGYEDFNHGLGRGINTVWFVRRGWTRYCFT